jgi:hypothetical protein
VIEETAEALGQRYNQATALHLMDARDDLYRAGSSDMAWT